MMIKLDYFSFRPYLFMKYGLYNHFTLFSLEYGNKVKRFCYIPQLLRFIPNI